MQLIDFSVTCTRCQHTFKARHSIGDTFSILCPRCKLEIVTATFYRGFVYILSNSSMPDLIKIGITERDPYQRAFELNATGVPEPFHVEAFFVSDDPLRDEEVIHALLDEFRVRNNREFFRLDAQGAIDKVSTALRRRPAVINDGTNPPLDPSFDDTYNVAPTEPERFRYDCVICGRSFTYHHNESVVRCPRCGGACYRRASYQA
jgi:DNA-directed RNA polymerase subunit RPC12/RpoP